MNTALKIGGYTLGLLAVFGAAVGIGAAVTPTSATAATSGVLPEDRGDMSAMSSAPAAGAAALPGGLMVSQDGYTLRLADRTAPAGARTPLRFQILGPDGAPVTKYRTEHDKELHLIVVRRDLAKFQHVHPVRDIDGTWSVPLDLTASGEYRIFADFTPTGHDGGFVLGADLAVPGAYEPVRLPEPAAAADAGDGYEVTLAGDLVPGQASELTLTVSKDGAPVTDLQPYLAAYGHLVALRAGDLAYLHVHPAGEPGDGVTPAGPGITFYATAPSAGDYRLYLDFQHAGVVRTAEFTVQAGGTRGAATSPITPTPSTTPAADARTDGGHDGAETDGHGH
ncbi:MAG TPA: hypothetical protein VIU11_07910 [Nakamurella sp.]